MADIYTTITGNVTADPQINHTNNGKAVTNVNVAVNHRVKDQQGNWQDGAATFVSGTVWEDMALNVCESLQKGNEVAMTGWMYTESFQRQDGTTGSALKMRVEHIGPTLRWGTTRYQKVDRRNGGQQGGGFGAQPANGFGAPAPQQSGWGQSQPQAPAPAQMPPQGQPQQQVPQQADVWGGTSQNTGWGQPQQGQPPF